MERIENFKSFSALKNQIREEAKNKEIETKRNESATSFAALLSKYGVSNVSEISEDELPTFFQELAGNREINKVATTEDYIASEMTNESIEVIEEGKRQRNKVVTAWKKSGLTDLNAIARVYADAMEDANFHQEMVTSKAIGAASKGKVTGVKASDISSAASWDGYAIANGTVDYLREIDQADAADKLYQSISKFDLNESVNLASLEQIIEEGTRGQFGKIYKSGEIASVYTHYDSYPEHMLPTIKKGYKKGTDVDAVLGKGDNSGLEVSPDKMKFYGDPRSLKPTMGTVKNLKKYISDADGQGAEYIYLFDERDQKWYMIEVYGDRELKPAFESFVNEANPADAVKATIEQLKAKSDQIEDGIEELEDYIDVLKTRKKKLEVEHEKINAAWDESGQENSDLEKQMDLITKKISEIDGTIETNQDQIEKREAAMAQISAKIKELRAKIGESVEVSEAEVDIIPEIEGEFMQLYSKLNDLAEETTDSKWRKAIEGIIKGLEGVEAKIGQTANKLGVVPTHEGNAFGAARAEAIAKGEKTFKVGDEEYDVENVDKEDEENAKEFANEAEGAAIPAETMSADTTKGEEKKVINGEEVDEEPKEVTLEPLVEGAKEEQQAMELYVKLVDTKTGKYTEKEMQAMSEKDIVDVVDAEGYKGSEAKKLASELAKIAKG